MNMLASRSQLRASFVRWALFLVPLCVLLGFLSGVVGQGSDSPWFQSLQKPTIYPDPKWFGIVWTILYVLIGLSTAMVAASWGARGRTAALWLFAVHFALNLTWTPVFFGLQQMDLALGLLIAIVLSLLLVMARYWKIRKVAALLLVPYLAWVCFATVLNYEFVSLNPNASSAGGSALERVRIGN